MNIELWAALLCIFFALGALLKLPWLDYLATGISVILILSYFWQKKSLENVTYTRKWKYKRGFPGEEIDLKVEISNNKWLPLSWIRVSDLWPNAIAPVEKSHFAPSHIANQGFLKNIYSLKWFQKTTRPFTIQLGERGIYPVGPALLESGDFFGIFSQEREIPAQEYITVFPEIIPLRKISIQTEDPFGHLSALKKLFEDPTMTIGVRPYHPEDDFRRVHWPATARTGELQVKIYQPVSSQTVTLFLNVSTTHHFWQGAYSEVLEQLVKLGATLVTQGIENGFAMGLFSNGGLAHSDQPFRILPGRSRNQLALLLEALAGVTPFTTKSFPSFLLESIPRLPIGTAIMLVTSVFPEELVEALVRTKKYRSNMTVLSIAKEAPPSIPGIRTIHIPFESSIQ